MRDRQTQAAKAQWYLRCGAKNLIGAVVNAWDATVWVTLPAIFLGAQLSAQNLVPNPGMENYTQCPSSDGVVYYAAPWISPTTGSTDLFHSCAGTNCGLSFPYVCVPTNWTGEQMPHSGEGYAGFFVTWDGAQDYREYVQAPLTEPLVAGNVYTVSFYVSLADDGQRATSNIGAHLSTNAISGSDYFPLTCCSPQVEATSVIVDKEGWTLISGCFTAAGGEQYITIGNFDLYANSTFVPVAGGGTLHSYYYLDDVSVEEGVNAGINVFGPDVTLCEGDSVLIDLAGAGTSVVWDNGSVDPARIISGPGSYSVILTNGCGTFSDTLVVDEVPSIHVDLGSDTVMCVGGIALLDATTPGATAYQWQNGSSATTLAASVSGAYWVQITSACGLDLDTVLVTVLSQPVVQLGQDITLCEGDSVQVDLTGPNTSVLWQDGSTALVRTITGSGLYWVTSTNGCGTSSDTLVVDEVPDVHVDLGSDTVICIGGVVVLDGTTLGATAYQWQNGSSATTLAASVSGAYWVQITSACGPDRDTVLVTVLSPPIVELGQDITLCEGDSVEVDLTGPNTSVLWQDGSTALVRTITGPGLYWVTTTNGCGTSSDTLVVDEVPNVHVDLGSDTVICAGGVVVLDATTLGAAAYQWQNGSSVTTLTVSVPGTYWVQITSACGPDRDTVLVTLGTFPIVELGADTIICAGSSILLNAWADGASYQWQDNSTGPTFNATGQGTYWVEVRDPCLTVDTIRVEIEACLTILEMPNVFSPNADGWNETFKPVVIENVGPASLKIFNRWGQLIFSTGDVATGWNGRVGSDLCSEGTYFWIVETSDLMKGPIRLSGYVSLLR
jgi:gliding motility-associated-like protein